jgi:alpha-galactosidase/6-phospho-beta-glucosidase family protein
VLFDFNAEALALVQSVCEKYASQAGSQTTVTSTTDREVALKGADAVVITISTGGLKAMRHDLEIPEKYNIYQMVGDTVGPGGISRTLRNVPVFLDLAHAMEQHCPNAWMLNCSNPLSALTRVVDRETSIKAIGVCHGVPNVAKNFAQFFNVSLSDCAYVNSGIDHCAWFTDFLVQGESAITRLKTMGVEHWFSLSPEEAEKDKTFAPLARLRNGIRFGLDLNVLPAIGDRHLFEFLPGYLNDLEKMGQLGLVQTRVEDREKGKGDAQEKLKTSLTNNEEVQIPQSSDNVAGWIAALYGGPIIEDNLNAPNIGQVPQLPAGAIVETRGVLDQTGIRPLVSPLSEDLEAIVRPHALREELTVDAALNGDFDKALAAMKSDPLLPSPEIARPLLEELIAATKDWLPQF